MQNRVVDPNELDENMSDETRRYVTLFLQTVCPKAILTADLNLVRQQRNQRAQLLNGTVKITDLIEQEFYVTNEIDGYQVPVTAYIPHYVNPAHPIVVFCHGGGWTFCSRVTHHHAVASLAQESKCIWISVEYRLAPEFKHPTGLDDCKAVVNWTHANKTSIFKCAENVQLGVSGDSAGGNYAVALSHELKEIIDFQILIYPSVQLDLVTESCKKYTRDCYILIPEVIDYFVKNFIRDENDLRCKRASPLLIEDSTNVGRTCIIATDLDPLFDQAAILNKKLLDHNVQSEFHIVKGAIHGYFNLPGQFPSAFGETLKHICNFLDKIKQGN
jgi:acetyl esterase